MTVDPPGAPAIPAGSGAALMARLDELARLSDEPDRLTRLYLTPAYKKAALQVRRWMAEAGMEAAIDAVGNVVGRWEGIEPGLPALLLGSHIDTVRDAGRYDGTLGVLAAVRVVAALRDHGRRLPFAIEVIAFGDEEGARFSVALTGSKAVAGLLGAAALDARDAQGVSLRDALSAFGGDPEEALHLARSPDRLLGYLELHIEQGPVLEAEGLPVGIVTAIAGASRFVAEAVGEAGHAGTVPMRLRRDALAAAAECVLLIERIAAERTDLVATVGRIEALPGAVNVIPAQARFTIDIRSRSDDAREDATSRLRRRIARIAARRRVGIGLERTYDEAAAVCAPWLVDRLEAAVLRAGIRPLRLASGAGHDGLAMAGLCPIGMLFLRCKGGISHSPAESITAEDAEVALRVLLDLLCRLEVPGR